jgi:hypothetical protein
VDRTSPEPAVADRSVVQFTVIEDWSESVR